MEKKEEEERQRKIESKQQLLAIIKADQIFREQEKEKNRKADIERQGVQDAHIQQMVIILNVYCYCGGKCGTQNLCWFSVSQAVSFVG